MNKLGLPTTLGEFRTMTAQYPDEALLQFRNEPRHELFEENGELIFNEIEREVKPPRNTSDDPLVILREDVYSNDETNMKVGAMVREQWSNYNKSL